jgi:hypothetical protein
MEAIDAWVRLPLVVAVAAYAGAVRVRCDVAMSCLCVFASLRPRSSSFVVEIE